METNDERGWVKPVGDASDTDFIDPIEPVGSTIRSSAISGIVLVAVVAAAVAGTVLWRGRNGDPFASARSIPADMDFVVTFDALALSDSERLQAFVDAFAVPMVEAEMIDDYPDDLLGAIDEAMAEANGLTLTDDVIPWIGRSVSIAGTVPRFDDPGDYQPDFSFLVSADVRDSQAAEEFVDTVLDEMGENNVGVTATEIAGIAGYSIDMGEGQPGAAMVLTDNALIIGTDDDVAAAVAARDAGLSIADDAVFESTMSQLSSNRLVSVYIAPTAFTGVTDLAALAGPEAEIDAGEPPFTAGAAAVSLVDEGLLFSYVLVGAEGMEGALAPDTDVLASLPAGTLGFVSVAGSGESNSAAFDERALTDLGYPLDELSAQIGVDVVALIESLSGDLTIAATETREGAIAASTDVPVGVVGALGLTEPGPIAEVLSMLEDLYRESGADVGQSGGVTTVSFDGEDIASYSVSDELLVIGTGSDLVADVVAGSGSGLVDSAMYQELDALVVGDGLIFYADIARIVGLVPTTSNESAVFAPLRGTGFGGEVRGDTLLMEVLVLVDY